MMNFYGSLEDLQEIVVRCATPGEWSFHRKSRFYRFQAKTGAILNWWPTTGTINFQGQDAEQFEAMLLSHAPWLACDASTWVPVPNCTSLPDRLPELNALS